MERSPSPPPCTLRGYETAAHNRRFDLTVSSVV